MIRLVLNPESCSIPIYIIRMLLEVNVSLLSITPNVHYKKCREMCNTLLLLKNGLYDRITPGG